MKFSPQRLLGTLLALSFIASPLFARTKHNSRDIYWKWKRITIEQPEQLATQFPPDFIWGVGTSAFQVEGPRQGAVSAWDRWAASKNSDGTPRVPDAYGKACDQWNKIDEDIEHLKQIGVGLYRFSLAWEKVEPQEGQFDQEVIDHYVDMCQKLQKAGIKAEIGFHHYNDPAWFADKGGFAEEKNIDYFVRFSKKMFAALQPYAHLWITINSPASYAAHGYLNGDFPPGIKNMQTFSEVMGNLLQAHTTVYHELKHMPGGADARIGLMHNIYQLDPWNRLDPIDHLCCYMGNKLVNECVFDYFKTGKYSVWVPFKVYVDKPVDIRAPQSLDFIALSYYSHSYLSGSMRIQGPRESKTDNPNYTVYPEGLYRALRELNNNIAQPLNIPIYVAENGICSNDENIRKKFFTRYMYALNAAMQDGINIKGYFFWSFLDNYEWGTYSKRYGIYHVDFNSPDLKRTLKTDAGTNYFLALVQSHQAHNGKAIQVKL